jgi:hypothetical protein
MPRVCWLTSGECWLCQSRRQRRPWVTKLCCSSCEPDSQPLARMRAEDRRGRVAQPGPPRHLLLRAVLRLPEPSAQPLVRREPLRRVGAAGGQRLAAVVDRHDPRVVVAAQFGRRVERASLMVHERHEVPHRQARLPERRHLRLRAGLDHRLGPRPLQDALPAVVHRRPVGRRPPPRVGRLGDQCCKQSPLLAVVREQVVVEEARAELLVDDPAVQADVGRQGTVRDLHVRHHLRATRPGQVVPAGGRAVGGEHVELDQVHVQPALDGQLGVVEAVLFNRAEEVGQSQLDDVAVVGPDEQRLARLLLGQDLFLRVLERGVDRSHGRTDHSVEVAVRVPPPPPVVDERLLRHLDVVVDHPGFGEPHRAVPALRAAVQVDEQRPLLRAGHERGLLLGKRPGKIEQPAAPVHEPVLPRRRGRRLLPVDRPDEPREPQTGLLGNPGVPAGQR